MYSKTILSRIILGGSAWIEAFRLIRRSPSLLVWLCFPILISCALTVTGAVSLQSWFWNIVPEVQTFPAPLVWIGRAASGVLIGLASGWTIAQFAWILSIPLSEQICRSTAQLLGRPIQDPPGFWRAFRWDTKKSLFVIAAEIGAIFTGVIPPLALLIHALILGFQALALVDTQYRRGLSASLARARHHAFETLGLGIVLAIGMSIPVLNWAVLQIGIIAATWLQVELQTRAEKPTD